MLSLRKPFNVCFVLLVRTQDSEKLSLLFKAVQQGRGRSSVPQLGLLPELHCLGTREFLRSRGRENSDKASPRIFAWGFEG